MLQNSNKILTILLFISIYYTTIVYSAFDTRLQIEGDAVVRTDQSIRITNLEITNTVNDAYEEYNSKHGKDTTSMYLILPASSSITYTVEITNKVSDSYLIDSIEEISNTNNNVGVDLSLNINDIVNSNSTKTFTITITNDTLSEQHETLVIEYGFKVNRFTVSFDANGGSVDTQSKTVSYGSTYGTLPTPTRAGYKFLGWNGKNLFDKDSVAYKTNCSLDPGAVEYCSTNGFSIYQINIKPNMIYTITNSGLSYNPGYALYDSNNSFILHESYNGRTKVTFTTPSTAVYIRFTVVTDPSSYRYDSNVFQLEEGSIVTPYEPYYITSSTTVVQPNNHTLTAQWLKIAPENCNGDDIVCINNYNDLVTLRDEVNAGDSKSGKTFFLTNDIDMGGLFDSDGNMLTDSTNWTSIGNTVNTPFSGTFDGNGHIIKKLYINTNIQFNSLFGYVNNGTIKNLGVEDSFIINNNYGSSSIIGYMYNSKLDSCYGKASVIGQKQSAGLVEYMTGTSNIINSYNAGSVNSSSNQFAGGIVGYKETNSSLKNCYNSGNVVGGYEVGGIVGGQKGKISNVYNVGTVSSAGITGQLYSNGIIKNSYNSGNVNTGGIVDKIIKNLNQQLINNYFLNTTASYGIYYSSNDNYPSNSNTNAEPLTAADMPSVLSVINGDNAFVADTNNINNGYPILKWQANRN